MIMMIRQSIEILCIILLIIYEINSITIINTINSINNNKENNKHIVKSLLTRYKCGSTNQNNQNATKIHQINVLVSTSYGTSFLDKRKSFILQSNSTINDLKDQINKKFPGSPPKELQRLFYGVRLINDTELISNITSMNPVPILLDMMTGTSVYDKSLSITQALEAYTAVTVQLSYISDKLRYLFDETKNSISTIPESSVYREMFITLNESLYNQFSNSINKALEDEKDPETISTDTIAWRQNNKPKSPLMKALAKEFDLNIRGIKGFIYYSLMLGFFAWYGTTGEGSSQFLLALVPVLWISKLRQLRIIFKILTYLILPAIANNNFIMPLLSAPIQVISSESLKWKSFDDEIVVNKIDQSIRNDTAVDIKDDENKDNSDYIDSDYDDEEDDDDDYIEEEGNDD